MKKLFKLLLCTLCVALVLTCLAACGKTYGVTFNAGESDGYVVTVKKGSKGDTSRPSSAPTAFMSKAGTTTSKERAKNSISTRKSRRT